jgi:hypothetical protein
MITGMETLPASTSSSETFMPAAQEEQPIQWFPTESQRHALARLHQLADVFFKVGETTLAGFRPACRLPLVIGASGSGKSASVSQFATQRELPMLALDCGSWIVAGAATKPATLRMIRDFVRAHEKGILFCDEVCKLLPQGEGLLQSGWSLSVFAESISLFSASESLAAHEWSPSDIRKLRNEFLCLGGGAFQVALTDVRLASAKGGLGFSSTKSERSHTSEVAKHLPEEILSRFSEVIVLEAPTRQDLQEAIERIHSFLGVKRIRPMKELVDEALGAAGGMRWTEKYLCSLLVDHPYCVRRQPNPRQNKKPDAKAPSIDLMVGDMPRCLAATNETAAALRVKLACIYSRLHQWSDQGVPVESNGLFNKPELGEALVCALRSCQLITVLSDNDQEELGALSQWRTMAWQVGYESATILAGLGITTTWMEAWSLTGSLIDYRMALRRAVQRGIAG